MIFRTINDEATGATRSIGLFGKSFSELKTIFSSIKSQGLINTLFNTSIINEDVIVRYNSAIIEATANNATMAEKQQIMKSAMESTNKATAQLIGSTNGAVVSTEALTAAQNQSTLAARAQAAALKAASIALNMIAFIAIAKGISFIAEKFNDLSHATEKAEEKAKSFASSAKSSTEQIAGNRSTLEKLNEEYQKLSKGVNGLGINTGLSADQYNRYKEIMAQVSDIIPDLTTRFNEQGEAIAFTKGKLSDLNEEYERYIQKDATEFLVKGDSDGNTFQDALDNFGNNSKMGFWENQANRIKNAFGVYDISDLPVDDMISVFKEMQNKSKDELIRYLNDTDKGLFGETIDNASNRAKAIAQHVLDTTTSEINKMDDEAFNQLQQDIASNIESLKNNIDVDMGAITSGLLKSMHSKDAFWALGEEQRSNVSTMLSSITADAWKVIWNGKDNIKQTEVESFVGKIIDAFNSNKKGFADAWQGLFSIDENIPVDEYTEKVRSFMNTICDVLKIEGKDNRIQWMISLGFDIEADEASLTGLKEKLSNLNGGAKNQDAAKWVDSLTKEELEFAHSDEFINALEAQKKELGNASLKAQDYEIALDKVKSAQDNLKDTEKITTISGILEKFGQTEAIDEYKDKVSSLQSYLEKLEDGNLSPIDSEALAKEFNIVGDTAEECIDKINAKIQSEKNNIIAIIDDIIAKGLADGSIGDAELERLRSYRDILTDIADVNLDNQLSFKTGNALADVQSLSQGLDQLDKIYADILDKEDFDFSSILNNDGFKKAFGAYTEEYENFINTVSKSPDDINACQDAFNKLTAAYIYGTGVLDEVTESTKAGTIAMLEQMGVSNAAAIVEQALAKNEEVRKYVTEAVAAATSDMSGKTKDASEKLLEEANMSETVRKALFELVTQQTIFANQDLGIHEKITGLEQLAKAYMGVAQATQFQDKLESNMRLNAARARRGGKELTPEEVYQQTMEQLSGDLFPQVQEQQIEIKYTGGTTTKDTRENLAKEAEKAKKDAEEAKEQFDWIIPLLDNVNEAVDKTKDKISDLLSFGSKKKQTQKAIEATTKALEAEYKAMKKYAEVAKTLSADAAKETTETVTESISGAVSDAVSNVVSSTAGVVNDAMQYVGKLPYVWGGQSLINGADCSGFVQQLYKAYGINLERTAQAQYNQNIGVKVSKEELQPGDLVFFNGYKGAGGVGHVGIYMGNGQFVHEPGSGQTAKVSYLSDRKDFVSGKRFGNINTTPSSSASVSTDTSSTTKTYTKVVPGVDAKTLAHYQKLIREGSFDVETITNEKLKNAIKSYQEWYEKMKSCRDKIEELNSTLKELYQTMAEIPIEKRDKNIETLDTKLDIINSKRDNINAVIVDPKKYASTQKTLKQSKTSVKKGIKTKAQRNATGLSKTEINTIKSQMKKGQAIPAKILGKIANNTFYEQCKQYNDAVYEHSQYAKSIRTAGDSIKKFNTFSNQVLDAEKSKTKQYKTAYDSISKFYGKSIDNVKSKGSQTKKAFGSNKFGLTSADINRINSCIKSGKQIPTDLMVQLESQSIFDSCVEYNKAVMENEILKEKLVETRFDLQKQQQAETTARLQVKTEKHQNIADIASAKMERNEALAENANTPKKKNTYLEKNLDLLQTEYKHLIKIAELENDSVKVAKLRAELEKETADIIEQQFQNISDYYSAKRDKISTKESYFNARYENALNVKDKNKILNKQTELAERNAKTYDQEYTKTAEKFNLNRKSAKKAIKNIKKLSSNDKQKILNLINAKEEIPDSLLKKVQKYDQDAYNKLISYNESIDFLKDAAWNKEIADEEFIKTKRENEIQKHQNIADRAQDKMDKNDALSEISATASERNKYETDNLKYLNTQYKHLLDIAKLNEDNVEYARLEAELQSKIAESYKAMFDNVKTEYENKISLISNNISDLDNEIKKVEASGRLIDASYYNYKISMENETLEKLKEEESSLVEQLKNVKMFSSAWYECQDAIQSVQNAQVDAISSIKEYKDAINEIANTIQNDIVDAFHDITDEAELLITLLGDNLSDEDTGVLTKDGLAVLSLYVSQMNICKDAAESFHKEIQSMQNALDSGTLSFIDANGIQREYASVFELKKAIKDFYSSYRDEIKHVYDYESKIVDMMIKKYQSELDYLKELIEKKKAELDAEKDLHDYAKSLKEQTDNINSLRKQIAALKGDTSKETESRIQKLQSQLKEAESSLEDQEYQRYISDQQDMLDNLYNEYAKLIDDVMKDHNKLLREGLDLFAQTGADVQDVIKITAEEHGYEITGEMEKIISSIESMGSLDSYIGVGGTITQSLGDIVTEIHNAYTSLSSDFQKMSDTIQSIGFQGKYDTSKIDNVDDSTSGNSDKNNSSNNSTNASSGNNSLMNDFNSSVSDLGKNIDHFKIATLLRNGSNKYDPKTTSSLNKYIYEKYGTALTVDEMAKLSDYLGLNYTTKQLVTENANHSKRKMKILDALKAYGFSNGGIVPDDALKVKDIGVKPASNGDDRLVALKPKESVFNEKQTKMIQEYVNKTPDYKTVMDMGNFMDKMIKIPEAQTRPQSTNVKVEYDNVNINLPNVMNYEDFMNHAKKDQNFEKMINCMISSRMGLGRRLDKLSVNFRH